MRINKQLLVELSKLCDVDASRYALGGVRVKRSVDGQVQFAATDGRRAGIVTYDKEAGGAFERIIPKAICQIIGDTDGNTVEIHDGQPDNKFRLTVNDQSALSGNAIEGRYPKIEDVVPNYDVLPHKDKSLEAVACLIDPSFLISLLRAARTTTSDVFTGITLIVPLDRERPVVVFNECEGTTITGILMPLYPMEDGEIPLPKKAPPAVVEPVVVKPDVSKKQKKAAPSRNGKAKHKKNRRVAASK